MRQVRRRMTHLKLFRQFHGRVAISAWVSPGLVQHSKHYSTLALSQHIMLHFIWATDWPRMLVSQCKHCPTGSNDEKENHKSNKTSSWIQEEIWEGRLLWNIHSTVNDQGFTYMEATFQLTHSYFCDGEILLIPLNTKITSAMRSSCKNNFSFLLTLKAPISQDDWISKSRKIIAELYPRYFSTMLIRHISEFLVLYIPREAGLSADTNEHDCIGIRSYKKPNLNAPVAGNVRSCLVPTAQKWPHQNKHLEQTPQGNTKLSDRSYFTPTIFSCIFSHTRCKQV